MTFKPHSAAFFIQASVLPDAELWCFSFVTLFNLQGTRPARPASRRNIRYLTTPSSVCQVLFSSFGRFFVPDCFAFSCLRKLSHYTRLAWVCQVLFSISFRNLLPAAALPYRLKSSVIVPDSFRFVKSFFGSHKSFFTAPPSCSRTALSSLHSIPNWPPFVKPFFRLLQIFLLPPAVILPYRQATCTVYQTLPDLSTPNFEFRQIFLPQGKRKTSPALEAHKYINSTNQ